MWYRYCFIVGKSVFSSFHDYIYFLFVFDVNKNIVWDIYFLYKHPSVIFWIRFQKIYELFVFKLKLHIKKIQFFIIYIYIGLHCTLHCLTSTHAPLTHMRTHHIHTTHARKHKRTRTSLNIDVFNGKTNWASQWSLYKPLKISQSNYWIFSVNRL